MKILKYQKAGNDKYKIFLEDNKNITLYEDVILDNDLLINHEIKDSQYNNIVKENSKFEAYASCVKYIMTRLRSEKEIRDYLKKKNISENVISEIVDKLYKDNLLNDNIFTKSFISDKLKFSSMGDYKIINELKKLGINNDIIDKYMNEIDEDELRKKISKLIFKNIKSNKKYTGIMLKNKVYNYLISLGYKSNLIIEELSKIDFDNNNNNN